MAGSQKMCLGFILLLVLFVASAKTTQSQDSVTHSSKPAEQNLELITTGEEVMLATGRHGGFRIYEARDGAQAIVSYVNFDSLKDANRQIEAWAKTAKEVRSKEGTKDQSGQTVGERIFGVTPDANVPSAEWFLIIRRVNLTCYFIRSMSLPVAKRVESLIEVK